MSIEKYLDEEKAGRYLELLHHGDIHGFIETDDYREYWALTEESIAKQREIHGEPKPLPFEGKCRRCGREFTDSVPEVAYPKGNHEIAAIEWCSDCNSLAMNVIFRESTAYKTKTLYDPAKGGGRYAGP